MDTVGDTVSLLGNILDIGGRHLGIDVAEQLLDAEHVPGPGRDGGGRSAQGVEAGPLLGDRSTVSVPVPEKGTGTTGSAASASGAAGGAEVAAVAPDDAVAAALAALFARHGLGGADD